MKICQDISSPPLEKPRVEVFAPGGEIEALCGSPALSAHAWHSVCRVPPGRRSMVFAAELAERWGVQVFCTPEWRAWWTAPERATAARPDPNFCMEVLE